MKPLDEIKPQQSLELLKELHILTRDGKINQDSRRKLKQVYHLYQFIEPILTEVSCDGLPFHLVDHGSGKSYLGFILYDLFIKLTQGRVTSIEINEQLVTQAEALAKKLEFTRMDFVHSDVEASLHHVSGDIDIVTALHACDTATDDAIDFGIKKNAKWIIVIPCCQAEIARHLKKQKTKSLHMPISELWRHALHTREMGSHLTNVLRCLQLESQGYQVTVTELVGWEHSMKNEIIIAKCIGQKNNKSKSRIKNILDEFQLQELQSKFLGE